MDTICENQPIDTSVEPFGRRFATPLSVDPVGVIKTYYSEIYTEEEYNDILVSARVAVGIAAFTGDRPNTQIMVEATKAVARQDNADMPTMRPWNIEITEEKMAPAWKSGAFVMAMDVDTAGLPFLKNVTPLAGGKSVEETKEIVKLAGTPLILKGIMTMEDALKAKEAGAKAVAVSNHGGRVLDQCPSTAEALPAIMEAAGQEVMVPMDGNIRSGVDAFKTLAMGADSVLTARPFVTVVYGGSAEDVAAYIKKPPGGPVDTMVMCGAHTIGEIARNMVWNQSTKTPRVMVEYRQEITHNSIQE